MGVARSICLKEPYFQTAFDELVRFPASEIFASRADKVRFYGPPDQSIIKILPEAGEKKLLLPKQQANLSLITSLMGAARDKCRCLA